MSNNSFIVNKTFDPLILRTIIKRYWWWPVVFVITLGTLAFTYLRYTKPVYESSLILQLSDNDPAREVLNIENLNSKGNQLSGIIELLRSELIFEQALKSLSMNVSFYSRGEFLVEEMYSKGSFYVQPYELYDSTLINQDIFVKMVGAKVRLTYNKKGQKKYVEGPVNSHLKNSDFDVVVKVVSQNSFEESSNANELFFIFNSIESISDKLRDGLNVQPLDVHAKTISMSFKGYSPFLCRDIVNALSESYSEFEKNNKRKGSENVLNFINVQLDSLSSELKSSKDSLIFFQRAEKLPSPESAEAEANMNLNRLQDDLFLLEEELNDLISVMGKLNNSPNRLEVYKILPEMLGKSYESSLAGHISELHSLLESKEDLLYRVTEESSAVRLLDKKISSKISLIQRSVKAVENRMKANRKVINRELSKYQNAIYELPVKKMEYGRLKKIQELNEKYFTLLTEKKVMYGISDAGYASSMRVLSSAKVPVLPIEPSKKTIYGAFIFFGFVIGLGIMLLKYLRFNEINLVEDLENLLPEKASMLGGVPLLKYSLEYSKLVVSESPKSVMAESMRKIRTNLSYIYPNYKTIAISSSISGEGKTFVALNLAGIIAMSGKKTVLLDLDLRKPKIHLGLDVENSKGMSSMVVGHNTLDECINTTKVDNLDFITAGPTPPNPSELLLSDRFKAILDELKTRYDVIVIDNPPVGLVSDGIRNLTEADIPIYVFKSHYSKRNFTNTVKELFEMKQLKSLNVILNGVQMSKSSGYGYGYGYGYGNGYGYMEEEEEIFKQEVKKNKWYQNLFNK